MNIQTLQPRYVLLLTARWEFIRIGEKHDAMIYHDSWDDVPMKSWVLNTQVARYEPVLGGHPEIVWNYAS